MIPNYCKLILFFVLIWGTDSILLEDEVNCFGLLAKSSAEITSCSNSSLYGIQNATFCLPVLKHDTVDLYLHWYFLISKEIIEASKTNNRNYTLYFGLWSIPGVKSMKEVSTSSYTSTQSLIQSVEAFVEYANWNRIAIISSASNPYYLNTAEKVYSSLSLSISVHYYQLLDFESSSIDKTLKILRNLKLRIIILSLPPTSLKEVLCKRLTFDMVWPEYAWLVLHTNDKLAIQEECIHKVIFFQPKVVQDTPSADISPDLKYHEISNTSKVRLTFSSICHQNIARGLISINIKQFDKNITFITNYNLKDGLGPVTLSIIPIDLPLQSSLNLYILFSLLYISVFIFVTVQLVLYICFRKEPEVKATGVSLNILTFLGCYSLLIYAVVLNLNMLPNYYEVSEAVRNFICFIELCCNGVSIPSAVILSVLLVKLSRVYRVFTNQGFLKRWECHDITLALYVSLLTSPIVLVCIIQTLTHTWKSTITKFSQGGKLQAFLECKSDYYIYWLFGQMAALFVPCSLLIIMAIKTRKIQLEDFKDTKKVIALMMAYLLTSSLGLAYFFVFQAIEVNRYFSTTLLVLTHCSFVLECQFFLFVPKFYPILKKAFLKSSTNSTSRSESKGILKGIASTNTSTGTH